MLHDQEETMDHNDIIDHTEEPLHWELRHTVSHPSMSVSHWFPTMGAVIGGI